MHPVFEVLTWGWGWEESVFEMVECGAFVYVQYSEWSPAQAMKVFAATIRARGRAFLSSSA